MAIVPEASCAAIIPARGGSKGVLRKNLLAIAGRPLLVWTIDAVAEASAPLRCIVTTDDDEIAAVAQESGAEVVRRPSNLATDEAPTEPALLHVLDAAVGASAINDVMLLQATSPVRLAGTLDRALETYRSSHATSLIGVVASSPFLWRGPTDSPTAVYDPDARPRRQDLTAGQRVYRETGSLYLTSSRELRATSNRISGRTELFVMDDVEGLDIDTHADAREAARLLEGLRDAARS